MEKYSEYKDSGVKWLGEIPSHWNMLALKHILKLKKDVVGRRSSQYDLLSLTLKGVVKRDMENPEGKFPASFDTYQAVEPKDFIFCNFDNEETPRAVGLSPYKGMITGAYDVLSRKNPKLTDGFLIYYFLYIDDAKRFKPLYKGLRKTVPFDSFMSYKIPVPSLKEQDAIVSYLDTATAKIDAAIAQQQKMIDLLNERKQIIINNAVTKGLNPNVKMKDSGVEWIGVVPEHWEVRKIKTVLKDGNSIKIGPFGSSLTGKVDMDLPYKVYGQWNIVGGDFFAGTNYISEKTFNELKVYEVVPGDIMISMMGTVGKCRVVPLSILKGIMDSHVVKIRLNNKLIENRYFEYFYDKDNSSIIFNNIQFMKKGSIMDGLNSSIIKSLILTFPSIKEQKEIIEYLNSKIGKIDSAVNNIKRKINLLQERKQIIINDVVTGKVKVV